MSCGVGRRFGSDPALLWLWCRLAATGPMGPLAWEPPYAMGVALEMPKRPKKKFKNSIGINSLDNRFECKMQVIKLLRSRSIK